MSSTRPHLQTATPHRAFVVLRKFANRRAEMVAGPGTQEFCEVVIKSQKKEAERLNTGATFKAGRYNAYLSR